MFLILGMHHRNQTLHTIQQLQLKSFIYFFYLSTISTSKISLISFDSHPNKTFYMENKLGEKYCDF